MSKLDTYKNIPEADKKDILELQERIEGFKAGTEDEEQFKLYRLTRGVYGQRQLGVQMFRIICFKQLTPYNPPGHSIALCQTRRFS